MTELQLKTYAELVVYSQQRIEQLIEEGNIVKAEQLTEQFKYLKELHPLEYKEITEKRNLLK